MPPAEGSKNVLRKADNRDGCGGVQRRKNGRVFQLLRYSFVNQTVLPELRAAMYDTVPYRFRRWRFCIVEEFANTDYRLPLASDWCGIVRQRIPLRIPHPKPAVWLADRFSNARE